MPDDPDAQHMVIAGLMSGVWLRKGTWTGVAVAVFAAGVVVVRVVPGEPRTALAEPPTHEVVSRAADSEIEVSPSLASQRDGTLAVAWIATAGGRDGVGRYVGARVSEPGAGKLGALLRLRGDLPVSDVTVVPVGDAFAVVWRGGDNVYSARIARGETAGEPKKIATGTSPSTRVRAAVAPNGNVVVAISSNDKLRFATSRDATAFVLRDAGDAIGDHPLAACADNHIALAAWVDESRGVHAERLPLDPEGPATRINVSNVGEHAAIAAPSCFIADEEAFVVYGVTDKAQADDAENALASSLVFAHSKDAGHNFLIHTPYRPPTRMMLPTLLHDASSFTLLGVMGSGLGDAHASASVILLGADGRMQNGLTQTIIAPVTMNVARDAAGYMGESLGLATVPVAGQTTTWTAVVDNQAGESHVALVAMSR